MYAGLRRACEHGQEARVTPAAAGYIAREKGRGLPEVVGHARAAADRAMRSRSASFVLRPAAQFDTTSVPARSLAHASGRAIGDPPGL